MSKKCSEENQGLVGHLSCGLWIARGRLGCQIFGSTSKTAARRWYRNDVLRVLASDLDRNYRSVLNVVRKSSLYAHVLDRIVSENSNMSADVGWAVIVVNLDRHYSINKSTS